ncbi:MAG TPA: NAD-dependent epimerase/dehydratase family protein [Acetobacteraceae bacterium]|nr:NAD-dependent epimerase/dehydratase family protein [Acetobacteraceae bacterium]
MSLGGRILVSGASGFIGRAITARLAAEGAEIVVALRRPQPVPGAASQVEAGDLAAPNPALKLALRGCGAVVHAAGLAHRYQVSPQALHATNVTAAARVAEAAAQARVPRLVLISSAAIHGKSRAGLVTEASDPRPDDEYAASKLAGEAAVRAALAGSATALTIVRPCAVVGPGCSGNIPRLARLLARGLPLPFGAIRNARSFIAVDDLAGLIAAILAAEAPPELVLAAHPAPISTPGLIRALARGLNRRAVLLPAPPFLLEAAAKAAGRGAQWQSFAGSFHADPSLARGRLGFVAPTGIETALERTAASLRQSLRYHDTTSRSS